MFSPDIPYRREELCAVDPGLSGLVYTGHCSNPYRTQTHYQWRPNRSGFHGCVQRSSNYGREPVCASGTPQTWSSRIGVYVPIRKRSPMHGALPARPLKALPCCRDGSSPGLNLHDLGPRPRRRRGRSCVATALLGHGPAWVSLLRYPAHLAPENR